MKYCILTIITTFLLQFASAQQPVFISDSIDTYIEREMQRWNIPAVSVAIVKDGKIILEKGYGVIDMTTGKKTDEHSLFMVASNSKAFTGTALSLLDYQKRISLNDKVTKYLPYFSLYDPCMAEMATVEDLMCHRLGFETFQGDFLNWSGNLTRREVVEGMTRNQPHYAFRDTYGYCNAGFVAAGEVLYAVTDTTWDDFIRTHFFEPLDMQRSSTTQAAIMADKNACTPYTMFEGKLVSLQYDYIDNLGPAASINSSAHDMANWLMMQLDNGKFNGKQIFPEQVVKMPRLPRTIAGSGNSGLYKTQHFNLYGLGWYITDYEGKRIYSHGGGANGFVTNTTFVPELGLGIVVLTNTDANALYDALRYQILEAYLQVPYRNLSAFYHERVTANEKPGLDQLEAWKKQTEKNNKPALPLDAYTGTFHNTVYGDIRIDLEGASLQMHFSHHPQLTGHLKILEDNTFVCYYNPVTWGVKEIPFTVENGKVTGLTVTVNDFIDFLPYDFTRKQ